MKANKAQVERALDAPPADIRLYLLYGPDEAGSEALGRRIVRAMGDQAERIDLDGATLKSDPARLADEAASISMFGDRRWIRVAPAGDEALAAVEALLEAPVAGNPVVLIAGALKATSAIVKLATAHAAAMACISYAPEGRDAEQLVTALARERGLRMASEIARRIAEVSGNDRALMAGEVEKLALYLDAAPERPAEASHAALDALIGGAEENLGALVNAVLGGDLPRVERELMVIRTSGGAASAALRPLMTRAMLLVQLRVEADRSGGRIDRAIEAAGKAVFWKDKAVVARQLRLWPAESLARLVTRANDAVRASRSSSQPGELMVEQALVAIARQAARAA